MKSIIKILTLMFITGSLVFIGCQEDEDLSYQGDEFIQFENASAEYAEPYSDTIRIPVLLAGQVPTSAVNVSVAFEKIAEDSTETVEEGVDYDVINEMNGDNITVTIPANSTKGYIEVVLYDDVDSDGNKILEFTLNSASGYVMGLPGSEIKNAYTLTILDDDCPFVAENFVGKPEGTDQTGGALGNAQVEFTLKEKINDNVATYYVSGLMMPLLDYFNENYGEEIVNAYPAIFTLDNSDPLNPTITMDTERADGMIYYTDDGGSTWQYYLVQNPDAVSKFSTCNRSIEAYYHINGAENEGSPSFGWTDGTLKVTFTTSKDGKLKDVKVETSFGKIDLDKKYNN